MLRSFLGKFRLNRLFIMMSFFALPSLSYGGGDLIEDLSAFFESHGKNGRIHYDNNTNQYVVSAQGHSLFGYPAVFEGRGSSLDEALDNANSYWIASKRKTSKLSIKLGQWIKENGYIFEILPHKDGQVQTLVEYAKGLEGDKPQKYKASEVTPSFKLAVIELWDTFIQWEANSVDWEGHSMVEQTHPTPSDAGAILRQRLVETTDETGPAHLTSISEASKGTLVEPENGSVKKPENVTADETQNRGSLEVGHEESKTGTLPETSTPITPAQLNPSALPFLVPGFKMKIPAPHCKQRHMINSSHLIMSFSTLEQYKRWVNQMYPGMREIKKGDDGK